MQEYKIKVITSLTEVDAVRPLWSGTHPFADYDFFTLIAQTRSITPCIIVLYRDLEPVCLLIGRIETGKIPIRFGYAKLGHISVWQLVFIAGGFLGEKTELHWIKLLTFIDRLMLEQKIDLAIFEQLEAGSFERDAVKKAFWRSLAKNDTKHWFMSIPATWNEFLKSRNRKYRYWLNRLPRILDREFTGQWGIKRYDSPDLAGEFVDAAERVAAKSYHRSLDVGFRRNEECIQRIALEARQGRLRGYVLFIKDEPKAFWYCFVYQSVLHLASTAFDQACRDYEVGTILLMSVFQEHCGTDVKMVDFGLGDAGYKQRLASNYIVEGPVYVFSSSIRGFFLYSLNSTTTFINNLGKSLLDRFQITQRIKTLWRRKLIANDTRA
ncbi:MAG: hypothetical protein RLZZ419_1679 [Pseudomonadota bacterium]|jgi:hypothetical protein